MKANTRLLMTTSLLISALSFTAYAKDDVEMNIKITPDLASVTVNHLGKQVVIQRDQDRGNTIPKIYSKTSRACPPFCIQPATIAEGVDTIAEIEMLTFLKMASDANSQVLVVDSRTADWVTRATIPGSVNIPWTKLSVAGSGAWDESEDAPTANDVMKEYFGVKIDANGKMNFSNAKTLVMFCNGSWCPQSSINIKSLIKKGYPTDKIKWYRGGLQAWVTLGLTTVPPR